MHEHHHHHSHDHHHHEVKNIKLAFWINLFFAIVELFGGIYTNSIAILSDALHDFGDSISLAFAWKLQKVSERKRDQNFTYGYRRFSLLSALIISTILIIGSIFVLKAAIGRFFEPIEPHAPAMMWFAIFGIVVNGFAALKLHGGSSLNEHAVALHMLEDVLGWAAVLIASIVMRIWNIPILDPILSIAIACWILFNAYLTLKKTFKVLLQGVPENVNLNQLLEEIQKIKATDSTHDVHLWTMDGEENIMTIHVVMTQDYTILEQAQIKEEIRQLCKSFNVQHCTIEIENKSTPCPLINC